VQPESHVVVWIFAKNQSKTGLKERYYYLQQCRFTLFKHIKLGVDDAFKFKPGGKNQFRK